MILSDLSKAVRMTCDKKGIEHRLFWFLVYHLSTTASVLFMMAWSSQHSVIITFLINFLLKSSLRFTAKLQGREIDFLYVPCPTHAWLPPLSTSPTRAVYLLNSGTTDGSTFTHHVHFKTLITLQFTLGVAHSMVDKPVMTCIQHCGIIRSVFMP